MERRPLAVRGTKWANDAARVLAQLNISPNDISLMSVAFSMLALLFFYLAINHRFCLVLAALCIQLRLICNLLDGMVAIEYKKKSVYGNLFNDIPDRFADVIIILGAGLYSKHAEQSSTAMTLAWINSIGAVLTAYIRVLGTSLETPTNFSGIMAKPQRMALLTGAALLCLIFYKSFPILFIAQLLMFIGLIITNYTRIKFIANHLKSKESI